MKVPSKQIAAVSSPVSKAAEGIEVRAVEPEEGARFERLLKESHYLGPAPPVGDFLRQVALRHGHWVGLLVWGPAAYKLKDRERWIGWSVPQRLERLKLVVQNRRFLLLSEKGQEPNLASQVLGAACKVLGPQWQQRFGYAPLWPRASAIRKPTRAPVTRPAAGSPWA